MLGSNLGLMAKLGLVYATWNPSDITANLTLSNGNLTATAGASSVGVRGTISKTAGKWYFAAKRTSGSGVWGIGFANASATLGIGSSAGEVCVISSGGYYIEGSAYGGPVIANNDELGAAIDVPNKTVQFYKNGAVSTFSLATYTFSGAVFPVLYFGAANGSVVVANCGASAFGYSPPAGYNPGVYQ